MHPIYLNIGFIGIGDYNSRTHIEIYNKWTGMLRRSYLDMGPTYEEVVVHSDWHNFQNFAAWYKLNFKSFMDRSWHLDKDILVPGNKVYGPDTCCFVPPEINYSVVIKRRKGLLPGVFKRCSRYSSKISINGNKEYFGTFDTQEEAFEYYKKTKEEYVKTTALEYYKRDLITLDILEALLEWKLEKN